MRLIDADALLDHQFKNDISYNAFRSLVKRQATIDAVPVVRCKACKYRDTFECGMQTYEYDHDTDLRKVYDWTKDDGYCYWGERKDV